MTQQTFTCWDNNAADDIVPLPRPYPCCGWIVPPLSFSGRYRCTVTGTPPLPPEYGCPSNGYVNKVWTLYSECPTQLSEYVYIPDDPNELTVYFAIDLRFDCYAKNGSDGAEKPCFYLYYFPAQQTGTATLTCSHVLGSSNYNIYYTLQVSIDFGNGNTVTWDFIIDQVNYP